MGRAKDNVPRSCSKMGFKRPQLALFNPAVIFYRMLLLVEKTFNSLERRKRTPLYLPINLNKNQTSVDKL